MPQPWQPYQTDSGRGTPGWTTISRVWRCSCGGMLDYEYHTVWRCRRCNHTHELQPMPESSIKVSADTSEFDLHMNRMRSQLRGFL